MNAELLFNTENYMFGIYSVMKRKIMCFIWNLREISLIGYCVVIVRMFRRRVLCHFVRNTESTFIAGSNSSMLELELEYSTVM